MTAAENSLKEIADSGVRIGQRWRHYKGGVYVVRGFALHEKTCEPLVLYATYDGPGNWFTDHTLSWSPEVEVFWSRTLSEFDGYTVARGVKRFTLEV